MIYAKYIHNIFQSIMSPDKPKEWNIWGNMKKKVLKSENKQVGKLISWGGILKSSRERIYKSKYTHALRAMRTVCSYMHPLALSHFTYWTVNFIFFLNVKAPSAGQCEVFAFPHYKTASIQSSKKMFMKFSVRFCIKIIIFKIQ